MKQYPLTVSTDGRYTEHEWRPSRHLTSVVVASTVCPGLQDFALNSVFMVRCCLGPLVSRDVAHMAVPHGAQLITAQLAGGVNELHPSDEGIRDDRIQKRQYPKFHTRSFSTLSRGVVVGAFR